MDVLRYSGDRGVLGHSNVSWGVLEYSEVSLVRCLGMDWEYSDVSWGIVGCLNRVYCGVSRYIGVYYDIVGRLVL